MNRRQLFPFLTAPLLLPLAGCAKTYSWRQKLTVVVETPSGEKSASSVSSVTWTENFFSHGWGGAQYQLKLHGEAVAVDLGSGRVLFALLQTEDSYLYTGLLALELLKEKNEMIWQRDVFERVLASQDRSHILVPNHKYPMLVTFRDTKILGSAFQVNPDNISQVFGNGFFLKKMILDITSDPVEIGNVEKFISVEEIKKNGTLSGSSFYSNNLPGAVNYLTDRAFIERI